MKAIILAIVGLACGLALTPHSSPPLENNNYAAIEVDTGPQIPIIFYEAEQAYEDDVIVTAIDQKNGTTGHLAASLSPRTSNGKVNYYTLISIEHTDTGYPRGSMTIESAGISLAALAGNLPRVSHDAV